jgi:hypothetical protein
MEYACCLNIFRYKKGQVLQLFTSYFNQKKRKRRKSVQYVSIFLLRKLLLARERKLYCHSNSLFDMTNATTAINLIKK